MSFCPITSWEIDGETVETCQTVFFGGSKITADGDCSHEMKRRLLLGRKVMTNLDSILKSRDITLPTKVRLVKAMLFPMVMYGCESWTVKKAERQRIDAFGLWLWRRLLRILWTARRSNQSLLKEISPGCFPGASVRNSTRGKGHEEGGSPYAKAGSSLRSPPGNSRASTPKTRVCLLSALCSHLHL